MKISTTTNKTVPEDMSDLPAINDYFISVYTQKNTSENIMNFLQESKI